MSVNSTYKDDPRFASISSEPYEPEKEGRYGSTCSSNSYSDYKLYSYFGFAFDKTKQIASAVKDKIVEYEIGNKIVTTGSKTVDVLRYTGSKVYEKSSEVAVY